MAPLKDQKMWRLSVYGTPPLPVAEHRAIGERSVALSPMDPLWPQGPARLDQAPRPRAVCQCHAPVAGLAPPQMVSRRSRWFAAGGWPCCSSRTLTCRPPPALRTRCSAPVARIAADPRTRLVPCATPPPAPARDVPVLCGGDVRRYEPETYAGAMHHCHVPQLCGTAVCRSSVPVRWVSAPCQGCVPVRAARKAGDKHLPPSH